MDAILFAAQNFCPVIFSDLRKPFRFDYLPPTVDASFLDLLPEQEYKVLNTFGKPLEVGIPKHILWERMIFLLSLNGLAPLANLCSNLRFEDNKIICFNDYSKIAEIRFEKCYYFGDSNISGGKRQKLLDNHNYLCYDWIAFNRGGKHDIDYFETSDNFVKRVWFFPSDRIDGNTAVKDACVLSVLNQEQLADFNFSETMARFKLVALMEAKGMRGLFNGYDTNGRELYYKFKTSHITRQKTSECTDQALRGVRGLKNLTGQNGKHLYEDLSQVYVAHNRLLRGA